jgi:hypothetical protein
MNADARGWAGGPAWCCTAKPGRPILMSSAGALAHVPSACIGVHLPASALDACLLAPPRAAPICKVARSLPPNRTPLHPVTKAETAGPTRPEVLRRQHPMSSGTASAVSPSCRRAPCRVRPKAHAPIRRGTTMAGRNCRMRDKRLRPGWPGVDRPMAWRQEPMHQNGPARWAADRGDAIRGDTTPCPAVRSDSCRLSRAHRTRCAAKTPYTRSSCPTGAAHRLTRSAMRRW